MVEFFCNFHSHFLSQNIYPATFLISLAPPPPPPSTADFTSLCLKGGVGVGGAGVGGAGGGSGLVFTPPMQLEALSPIPLNFAISLPLHAPFGLFYYSPTTTRNRLAATLLIKFASLSLHSLSNIPSPSYEYVSNFLPPYTQLSLSFSLFV